MARMSWGVETGHFTLQSRVGGDLLSRVQGKRCETSAVTPSAGTGTAQDWASESDRFSQARGKRMMSGYFKSCLTCFVLLLWSPSLPCSLCSPGERSQCHIPWNTALSGYLAFADVAGKHLPSGEQRRRHNNCTCVQCTSVAGLSEGEGNFPPQSNEPLLSVALRDCSWGSKQSPALPKWPGPDGAVEVLSSLQFGVHGLALSLGNSWKREVS